ncbi:sushi, von Willebrand factor type A, EGF and pentraxin domain-containing protein 1-like isoform X2 [Lytechinus pictus]|uniref:sushi, von Willebrand factor type A, EGF and pentraxin domain-containing protein 1-like isoform X2 n=1 Tax=Lytechinus pictus TaxID=7653 RepID=UPI0030B9C07D
MFSGAAKFVFVIIFGLMVIDFTLTSSELQSVCGEINVTTWYNVSRTIRVTYIEEKDGVTRIRARNEIHFFLENRTELQDVCCPGFTKHGNACLIVNCSIPDVFPSHLSAVNIECSSGATVEYNTSCTYECDTGYMTISPTSLSCTESGELSMDLPNCTVVTCSIPDDFPPHVIAIVDGCTSGSFIEYGTSCAYECDTGYQTTDLTKSTCLENGTLSIDLPACTVVNCSIPDVFPSHLSALNNECSSGATVEYNTSCSYDCDNGYNTTGPTSLSCTESGELSGDLPNCTGDVTLTSSELQSVCGEINVTIWYNVSRTIRVTYIEEKDGVTRMRARNEIHFSLENRTELQDACCPGFIKHGNACLIVNCSIPVVFPSHLSAVNIECSSGATVEYNTSCTYECDTGYMTTDPASLSCAESGELTMDLPNCIAVTCSIPDAFSPYVSATESQCSSGSMIEYNTSCTYECDTGHRITGAATLLCSEGGQLSGNLPNCTDVTCIIPDDFPSHLSSVDGNCSPRSSIGYNTTCTFVCDTGYNLVGSNLVSCTGSGALSAELPSCANVSCDVPSTFDSVTSTCDVGSTVTYSTSCEFSCTSGVIESGNAERFCRADGTFSGNDLTCTEVMCNIPIYSSPLSSSQCHAGGRVAFGTLCQFNCESGDITQPANITCTNTGQLQNDLPQCPVVTCSIPDDFPPHVIAIVDGCTSGSIIEYGTSCAYECDTGYQTTDLTKLTCLENGMLSIGLPNCSVVTCSIPEDFPPNVIAIVDDCSSGSIIEYGTSCAYKCDTGYQTTDLTKLTCLENGTLSIDLPTCTVVNCSIPDVFPSHLSAVNIECSSGATVEYNTSCTYECDTGYMTTGPTSLSCAESGELTMDLPNCTVVTCSIPDDFPPNVIAILDDCTSGSIIEYGTSCAYECDTGYQTTDLTKLTCLENGTLSIDLPTCTVVTCSIPDDFPPNVIAIVDDCSSGSIIEYGTSCAYECDTGYQTTDLTKLTCLENGTLSIELPTCTVVNCSIPDVFPSHLSAVNIECSSGATVEYNTSCTYECDTGYMTTGPTSLSCAESGELTMDLPNCTVVTCSIPDDFPPNVIAILDDCTSGCIIEYGTSCAYECDTGYQTTDLTKLTCLENGTLSIDLPTCTVVTCSIPDDFPPNVIAILDDCSSGSIIEYGTSCAYECDTGYQTTDLTKLTCLENGTLSIDLPTCTVVTCSIPDDFPPHVIAIVDDCTSGSIIEYGASCAYKCDTGYQTTDLTKLTCLESGTLSIDLPTCTVVNCSIPDVFPSHLSAVNIECSSGATVEYDTSCTYECDTGYMTTDPASLLCAESGELTMDLPNCIVVTCSIPDAFSPYVSATESQCSSGSMIEYNTSCTYECDTGYRITGAATLLCSEGGQLSGNLPNCTDVTCIIPDDFPSHLSSVDGNCSPRSSIGYNTTCTFVCDTGYNLVGSNLVSCTGSGALSAELPSCANVLCDVPSTFDSVTSTCDVGSTVTYSTSCEFSCTSGVIESGNAERFCRADGTFSGNDLTCAEVMCNIPVYSTPLSSSQCHSGGRVAVGTLCQFNCESGDITQPANIICTNTGQLQNDIPQCPETCGSAVCSESQYCGSNDTCRCVRGSLTAQAVCSDSCRGACSINEICAANSVARVSACDCAPGKVREMDNNQCLDAVNLEGTITVLEINGSEAIFSEELGNTGSSEFQQIESTFSQQIMSTIGSVNHSIDDVTIISITSGSLIITYRLVFATAPESNPEVLADELSMTLKQHLDSNNGILDSTTSTIYQVDRDAPSLQVLTMDECSDPNSNDCSSNAICINHDLAGGFTCKCLPGYRDLYPEVLPGRFCFTNHSENSDPDDPVTGKAMYLAIGIVCGVFIVIVVIVLLGSRAYVNSRWRKYYEESVNNPTTSETYSRKYPYLDSYQIELNGGLFDEVKSTQPRDHPLYVNYSRTNAGNGKRTSRRKDLTSNSEAPKFSSDGPTYSSAGTDTNLDYSKAISTNGYHGYGGQHLHYPYHNGIVIKDHLPQTKRLKTNGGVGRYSSTKPRGHMGHGDHLPLDAPHRATYVTRF